MLLDHLSPTIAESLQSPHACLLIQSLEGKGRGSAQTIKDGAQSGQAPVQLTDFLSQNSVRIEHRLWSWPM